MLVHVVLAVERLARESEEDVILAFFTNGTPQGTDLQRRFPVAPPSPSEIVQWRTSVDLYRVNLCNERSMVQRNGTGLFPRKQEQTRSHSPSSKRTVQQACE